MRPPFLISLSSNSIETYGSILAAYQEHGVVLLRGGHKFDLQEFEEFTKYFCEYFHGAGTRQTLRQSSGDGFTTEVYRDDFILLGHTEGSYRPYPPPPDLCFFMCVTPPGGGGETVLVDGAEMLALLPDALAAEFMSKGIVYECRWDQQRWQAEFGVEAIDGLVAFLSRYPEIKYDLSGNILHVLFPSTAVTRTRTGVTVFANSILAHLPNVNHPSYAGLPVYANPENRVYFGDGEVLPDNVVNTLIDVYDKIAYRHAWQPYDVLMIDNTRYMHGRTQTTDSSARILISRFGCLKASFMTSPRLAAGKE